MAKINPKIDKLAQQAFERLEKQAGFEVRPVQHDMAQFVTQCVQGRIHGLIEAPTGVGKSLGALIPALAWAIAENKRVIVATYTNVLAEQYWQKDLPLALQLFGEHAEILKTELVMGKPRYACLDLIGGQGLMGMPDTVHRLMREWVVGTLRGTENEFASFMRRKRVPLSITRDVWKAVHVPPVCRQKLCAHFDRCFYFRTRRSAARANVVVTNHSVILADAELRLLTGGSMSMLDEYDLLILDEAHDFLDSTRSAMEFSLDDHSAEDVVRMAARLTNQILQTVESESPPAGFAEQLQMAVSTFAKQVQVEMLEMSEQLQSIRHSVLVTASPTEILEHPGVQRATRADLLPLIRHTAQRLQTAIAQFYKAIRQVLTQYKASLPEKGFEEAKEMFNQQGWWFKKFAGGLQSLLNPETGATWIEVGREHERAVRTVPLEFSDMLKERMWDMCPTVAMSATLAIDGSFEFFQNQTGLTEAETCRLPQVFDYVHHAALYLPTPGRLPEPPQSAKARQAADYYNAVANELETILTATKGRALVLFSSRAEMEAVRERVNERSDIPIYVQGSSGHADLSQQFKENTHSVLFGLRSFWTGFDAPGQTLSCVVLVRIPFEVPVEPAQVARNGLIESRGGNPFLEWTLPNSKQQIKQGAGRLLRRSDDRGIICILDARLHTKNYGHEILQNLPEGIPIFNDILEAVKHAGLS
jgi:ATP-dependent DNA helicase DinG